MRDLSSRSSWAISQRSGTCAASFATCRESPDHDFPGDWIPVKESPALLKEVNTVLHSSDILAESEKEFFTNMKLLCEASIATGNPIMF
jgi:hypothetical protein